MTVPLGLILVSHEVLDSISQAEMLQALPDDYKNLPRHHVSLSSVKSTLAELGSFDWFTARRHQSAEVLTKLKPVIDANPEWRLQYFGAAPIPLAMALGYQLGGWADADVYQKLHSSGGSWRWPQTGNSSSGALKSLELPKERLIVRGDMVLRVSISHTIHADETLPVIAEPMGEIDIGLQVPSEDGLQSAEDLEAVMSRFDEVLDWAQEFRPNVHIYVFVSLAVGAAFRFGTRVNPTIHNPVHVHQYFAAQSPRYQRAFVLQQPGSAVPVLANEDRVVCAEIRKRASEELEKLKVGSAKLQVRGGATWLDNVFPNRGENKFSESLTILSKVYETPLPSMSVDLKTTDVPDGFSYNTERRAWALGDTLLHDLGKTIANYDEQRLSLRLFLLHESIHRSTHHLTGGQQIRRFPKIVEELDYQADVWAFLHELALSGLSRQDGGAGSIRADLLAVIKAAINTFWAFDASSDSSRMEIRRVNRYLIWYWQRLEIEALADADVVSVLRVLANRPLVEVAGPTVKVVDGRVFFLLNEVSDAEIGLVSSSRLFRFGHGNGSQVTDILRGFLERNDETIASALHTIFDQVR